MTNDLIEFKSIKENKDLVAAPTYEAIMNLSGTYNSEDFLVAEINPDYSGGVDFSNKYNIDPKIGINCLIAEAKIGTESKLLAMLVPVGYRYNMSKVVRPLLQAKSVSVANLEEVLEKTKMEYGSINPIGLPKEWIIYIDPLVLENEKSVIGSGLKNSKLLIYSKSLLELPNAVVLENLAKPFE